MNVQQSLVLGVIQGLTEFIPVSSTAHLILAQNFSTGLIPTHPHTYDTFIQIGTVIPVLIYFWRDWLKMLQAAGRIVRHRKIGDDLDERMVKYLFLGSIPAGVLGLLFEKRIEQLAEPDKNPIAYLLIGGALIVVGIVMWWAERVSTQSRGVEHVQVPDAWIVGFAQALALFPGVSRSGATITAGLFTGLTREAAARFSFLLMTPIMLAATGYKGLKMLRGIDPMTTGEWQSILLATVVAALTGWLAIAFLLRYLKTRSLAPFAVYRIAVGAFSIGVYFTR